MKTVKLSTLLALVLSTLILSPVYADSNSYKKEHRYDQRRNDGNRQHNKQPKQYSRQQQKSSQVTNKNLRPNQRKQEHNNNRKNSNQGNHQRSYSTHRNETRPNKGYSTTPRSQHYPRHYSRTQPINRHYSRGHNGHNNHYEVRHGKRLLVVTPRHRTYHNIYIARPYGHTYYGYGHYVSDNNAWRWLTFTAITLKLLDMVDEQAQREHEEAQIEATSADVGEKIYWDTDEASGHVVTTRKGTNSRGQQCREYQHSITVGGETEEAYGTACLQPDGSWKIIN